MAIKTNGKKLLLRIRFGCDVVSGMGRGIVSRYQLSGYRLSEESHRRKRRAKRQGVRARESRKQSHRRKLRKLSRAGEGNKGVSGKGEENAERRSQNVSLSCHSSLCHLGRQICKRVGTWSFGISLVLGAWNLGFRSAAARCLRLSVISSLFSVSRPVSVLSSVLCPLSSVLSSVTWVSD